METANGMDLSPRGRTYFVLKNAAKQCEQLGILNEETKVIAGSSQLSLDLICQMCAGSGFWPLIWIVPYRQAKEIEEGNARLVYRRLEE